MATTGDPETPNDGTSKTSLFSQKSSRVGIFSRKPGAANIASSKPKSSRSSFFQNLKSKPSGATLAKGKENEDIVAERPEHPAYGLPGEGLPAFDESLRTAALAKRASISGLIDLEGQQQTGWQPLFKNDVEDEVPDVGEGSSAIEQKIPSYKGKEKAPLFADTGAAPLAESADMLPEGLPHAYQIVAGRDARKCPRYNCSDLYNGLPVRELWNNSGDTLIYLCPKNMKTPHGPSFQVDSHTLQSTSDYWVTAFSPVWQNGFEIDKSAYPTAKFALFFAADRPDGRNEETDPLVLLRHYITMRNVFACIFDSFCVGLIEEDSSLLSDLVDRMLMYFDGTEDSLGEKLSQFIQRSGLWDVSNDPIKAVDLLHLAATYDMEELYLEAFAHTVGMWPQIVESKAHEVLSESIITLLVSRHGRLVNKLDTFSRIIKNFHFKELWTINSPASKLPGPVRKGYESMRTFLYKYYTTAGFSKWPPRDLATRSVFFRIYSDFCVLYELLVDKQYTTTNACACYPSLIHYIQGLYHIDQVICKRKSSMPYGIPILPGYFVQTVAETAFLRRPEVFQVNMEKKLDLRELDTLLERLYNDDGIRSMKSETGERIMTAFMGFEKSLMKGKTYKDVAETRKGIWFLVYGMLSVMAELSVETKVVFKDEVEYLLCADTGGVFNRDGKRRRVHDQQDAGSEDEDIDRWSMASLPGTQPDTQYPPVAGSSTITPTPAAGVPEDGTSARKITRAEMSYPWTVAQKPGWAAGTRQQGA
ncbi:hypothetical protein TWF730_001628 [Orbilia blumenaviensis]|uniref:DUF8004 domain-containing protein n=1 Tax=Orbilia blumenaviensis TaxID=1796055 RepID=A0AAV9ULW7_9PEZI